MMKSNTGHNIQNLSKHIIFIGQRNVGKSFWGERIALDLDLPFWDTDFLLRDKYGDFFYLEGGEKLFRKREHEILSSLGRENIRGVIATGAGCIMYRENANLLKELGIRLFLQNTRECLWKREQKRAIGWKKAPFFSLFSYREKLYCQWCDITISCAHKSKEETREEILSWLKNCFFSR